MQAYTKQQGSGDIASAVQQIRLLQYIIMVIIAMFWRTFGRRIVFIYIDGRALKSLSLLGKN